MADSSQERESSDQVVPSPSFGEQERTAALRLIELALEEDLGGGIDLTSQALVSEEDSGRVSIVARQAGHLSGLPLVPLVFSQLEKRKAGVVPGRILVNEPSSGNRATQADEAETGIRPALGHHSTSEDLPASGEVLATGNDLAVSVSMEFQRRDGDRLLPGDVVATLEGKIRDLLTAERTVLNFLTHLSGIASLTGRFVEACRGTPARILDTRKTHAGWRSLEKYAVRCGGGANHRLGLNDGLLIKDNHLANWSAHYPQEDIAAAVLTARQFVSQLSGPESIPSKGIEVEVDTLEQLENVLTAAPEIVLLDNMSVEQIREAIALRDCFAPETLLEASGGITLENVATIAATGIDRISIGALTHSAPAFDLAFDWAPQD